MPFAENAEVRPHYDDALPSAPTRHVPEAGGDVSRAMALVIDALSSQQIELDGTGYEIKVVREEGDWQALEPLWDALLLAMPEHTVFQSHRYQRLWWRHFANGADLFVVLILQNGVVRGIAPMQLRTVKYCARSRRYLSFIGTRWEVDRPTFLFPTNTDAMLRVFVRFLASGAEHWDFGALHEQRAGSPELAALREAFRVEGYLVATARDSECAYLPIQGTWDAFLAAKSSTFRKNLKTAGRRLRALGDLQYRVYDSAPDVFEQLERYREIEQRSWKSEKGVGVSRNDDYFEFYRELARAFVPGRHFVIRMLTLDDKPVAGTFGLRFDGVLYSLQIVHDREFSRCSPGTYLEALEMEECFGGGYREYEFLGGFLNNKSRWTSTFRHTTQLYVYRRTPFFAVLMFVKFQVQPRLKALVQRCKAMRRPAPARTGQDATHE